ncbi:MAG: rRNA pseudouridine synthase [Candidatus Ancillula sp.]|jgi:23S rRNA pseudouridine2605 synthase|nr:rRNA pseudouridine synthase [Candidatus Ancillula sp.]
MVETVKIQKVIAQAGYASRRGAEDLILDGRVEVNDEIVLDVAMRIDPTKDVVRVDGEKVNFDRNMVTIAVNKPKGVVSAMEDPQGRPTLSDLVGNKYGRLFHIGRLDTATEGLILMSNDGDLAQLIAHPSGEIQKVYVATVNGKVKESELKLLAKGFELNDGFTKFDKVRILAHAQDQTVLECVLHSGKNRIVRRMLKYVNHPVQKLVRVQIGPIRLGELKSGRERVLSDTEVSAIEALAKRGKKSSQFDISVRKKDREKRLDRRK